MPVPYCHVCQAHPEEHKRYNTSGLENGDYCPVCHQPTCENHLATVRFRWLKDRQIDSARVCIDCKRAYRHRHWDVASREWIS
jgi:hypothetical protein